MQESRRSGTSPLHSANNGRFAFMVQVRTNFEDKVASLGQQGLAVQSTSKFCFHS